MPAHVCARGWVYVLTCVHQCAFQDAGARVHGQGDVRACAVKAVGVQLHLSMLGVVTARAVQTHGAFVCVRVCVCACLCV
eukprot:15483904-Alexandrium_andersonii.AAC.1